MTAITLDKREARKLATDGSLLYVRPVKEQPPDDANFVDRQEDGSWQFGIIGGLDDLASAWGEPIGEPIRCPLTPGTEVWGRETWRRAAGDVPDGVEYKADGLLRWFDGSDPVAVWRVRDLPRDGQWLSPVTMSREFSRFPRLLVGQVRCVRVGELGNYANHRDIRRMGFGDAYKAPEQLHNYLVTWWQSRYAKTAPWPTAYTWAVELTVQPDSPAKEE